MKRKCRVGAVSYLNTKPFIYGLQNGPVSNEIELILDYPSKLVDMLKSGEIDIGLIPVGSLPGLETYHLFSNYCIATEGEVASVAVFSQVPLEEIESVYLDYQSKTSVLLCKIIFEKYFQKTVNYIHARDESYLDKIGGKVAGLIIGDRALSYRSRTEYIYDLGSLWRELTGLPFVFASWITLKTLDNDFVEKFSASIKMGIEGFMNAPHGITFDDYDLNTYFTKNISYLLDGEKREGLSRFLMEIPQINMTHISS